MSVTETREGVVVKVLVKPNSSKFSIEFECGEIVVRSTEEPVKGKVNKEILKEFTKIFRAEVRLVSGVTSKEKRLLIKERGREEVERLLHN